MPVQSQEGEALPVDSAPESEAAEASAPDSAASGSVAPEPASIEAAPAPATEAVSNTVAEPTMGASAREAMDAGQRIRDGVGDPLQELTAQFDFVEKMYNITIEFFVNYSFQVIGAVIILIIGVMVSRWLGNLIVRVLEKRKVDVTLRGFLGSSVRMLVLGCFVIIALGKFGISVAPFVAAIGAVGLGAGLAMQGLLSNYGAGFNIILTRPFVVGNTITINGVFGVVKEIHLAMTLLETEDGELITVPNRHIVGEVLQNSFEYRVVEAELGIAYDEDADAAVALIRKTVAAFEQVAKAPGPQVGIASFGDSSVNIGIRFWVPTREYFQCQYEVNGAVYRAVKEANITIPFPQREVRMLAGSAPA